MKKRIRLAFIVGLVFLSACAPYRYTLHTQAYAYLSRSIPRPDTAHTELRFSEIPFIMPNMQSLQYRAEKLQNHVDNDTEQEEDARMLQAELDALWTDYKAAETMCALAQIRYSQDITSAVWTERYEVLSSSIEPVYGMLVCTALKLSERKELRAVYDAERTAELRAASMLTSPELASLLQQEQKIIAEYDRLHVKLTVEGEGRTWNFEELMGNQELPFAAWYALYSTYTERYAEEAAALFCRLLPIRNAIATALGFDSYTAYRYAAFGRSCTPDDTRHFCETTAKQLVPLFLKAQQKTAIDREILYYADTYEQAATMDAVGKTVAAILPELAEPWQYMIEHDLYDAGRGQHRLGGSYTTFLSDYGAPFLFTTWDDSPSMPSTMLHEFGHFAGYYFRAEGGNASGGSLDLAELDSQGLELLAIPYYDKLFGNRADEAKSVRLADTLYTILSACAVDTWEQLVYASNAITPAALHTAFGEIISRYGLDRMGFTPHSWTEIPHIFQSPCYYISYGIGGVSALELYAKALENPGRAASLFQKLLLREEGANLVESLQKCDLTDPMADDTIISICKFLRKDWLKE